MQHFTYDQPVILVARLDGPIVQGSTAERERLYSTLTHMTDSVLVYVTDRYLESARAFQELMHLPRPHVFVTDMGTSVAPGWRDRSISVIDQELDRNWPGPEEILSRLEALDHLMDTHPLEARRRISFMTRDGVTTREVLPRAQQLLDPLDVQVVAADSIQLDVLPSGVTQKQTLDRVLSWIEADRRPKVLIVVGSADDMSLVDDDSTALVIADPDDQWPRAIPHHHNVHVAPTAGCAGIYESLIHFGLIDPHTALE